MSRCICSSAKRHSSGHFSEDAKDSAEARLPARGVMEFWYVEKS